MKVADLSGALLNYWVAQAEAPDVSKRTILGIVENGGLRYSDDWSITGPIIEREGIRTSVRVKERNRTLAWAAQAMNGGWYSYGDTLLEAAMRCYVASKFGEEVKDH